MHLSTEKKVILIGAIITILFLVGAVFLLSRGELVTKDETKLGRWFQLWGKELNSNCIFDKCNGSEGAVKMVVNGNENNEFENYLMKDGDRIEIKYE